MNKQQLASNDVGTGPTVVLVHAFPLDRTMWLPQMSGWNHLFGVVTLDLPGFGGSPLPAGGCDIDQMADAVAAALDELKIEKAVVGGLSMGGYVTLAFARRHADRLQGLILADTKAEPDDDAAKANRGKVLALLHEQGVAGLIDQMIPKLLGATTQQNQPELAQTVRSIALRQSVEGVANGIAALRDRPDARPGLSAIQVPTLVIVGDEDVVTPPNHADELAKQIPDAKLATISGAGHLANLEKPSAFCDAVANFVKTLA